MAVAAIDAESGVMMLMTERHYLPPGHVGIGRVRGPIHRIDHAPEEKKENDDAYERRSRQSIAAAAKKLWHRDGFCFSKPWKTIPYLNHKLGPAKMGIKPHSPSSALNAALPKLLLADRILQYVERVGESAACKAATSASSATAGKRRHSYRLRVPAAL